MVPSPRSKVEQWSRPQISYSSLSYKRYEKGNFENNLSSIELLLQVHGKRTIFREV
jgi:hypothetical protein